MYKEFPSLYIKVFNLSPNLHDYGFSVALVASIPTDTMPEVYSMCVSHREIASILEMTNTLLQQTIGSGDLDVNGNASTCFTVAELVNLVFASQPIHVVINMSLMCNLKRG